MSASYSPVYTSLDFFNIFVCIAKVRCWSIYRGWFTSAIGETVWKRCTLSSIFHCMFFSFCWVIRIFFVLLLSLLIYPFVLSFFFLFFLKKRIISALSSSSDSFFSGTQVETLIFCFQLQYIFFFICIFLLWIFALFFLYLYYCYFFQYFYLFLKFFVF